MPGPCWMASGSRSAGAGRTAAARCIATSTWASAATNSELATDQHYYTHGGATPTRAVQPFARWMAGYQRFGFLRGTLLGVVLLIGLAGITLRLTRGGFRHLRGWGGPALYPWTAA